MSLGEERDSKMEAWRGLLVLLGLVLMTIDIYAREGISGTISRKLL